MMKNRLSLSALRKEALAGFTTFLTMAYIIFVNPSILSTPGTGLPYSGVLAATVLLCFLMTLLMGLYADLPFAVAPGMGINAFFTYTLILGKGIPWPIALGMVFWSGLLFVLISLSPLRVLIAKAIPLQLRTASAVGIGLFLTFIGLKNSGLIVAHPVTFVTFGKLGPQSLLCLLGLFVIIYFMKKKKPYAFLVGILFITLISMLLGYSRLPPQIFSKPDFSSVFMKLNFLDALKLSFLPAIVAIFFTDLFDSISTFIGVSQACNLLDKDGEAKNLKEGLLVDAFATMFAGLFGTSAGTAYIESAAGIQAGGRSGASSVVTALCFLPFFFIAPIAGIVPPYATAPVLILVGFLTFESIGKLTFQKIEDAIPAFLTVVLIPLTFSITQGIIWGFISYIICYVIAGRSKEIKPMMYIISAISLMLLYFENKT